MARNTAPLLARNRRGGGHIERNAAPLLARTIALGGAACAAGAVVRHRLAQRQPRPAAALARPRPAPACVRDGLAIFRFGGGEPLLLMPYPHAISVVGDPVLAALIDGFVALGRTVVTFDPPGSGQSPRPLHLGMAELLDCAEEALGALGVPGAVDVAGHSQGGVAALALAIERPARVRRLILIGASPGGPAFIRAPGAIWNAGHPHFWRFGLLALLHVALPVRATETLMNNVIFRASHADPRTFTPAPVAARDWLRPARPRAAWGQRVARRLDYGRRLGEVQAPTLVLVGLDDPQMPPACAEELASGIPAAGSALFERSGHYPFLEEPIPFWETVGTFLALRDSARGGPVPTSKPDGGSCVR